MIASYFVHHKVGEYSQQQHYDSIVDAIAARRQSRRLRYDLPSFAAVTKALQRYTPVRVHGNSSLSKVEANAAVASRRDVAYATGDAAVSCGGRCRFGFRSDGIAQVD
jgi:hypothetical protein